MSLETFIDTRFGDPVLALSLNYEAVVYGSAVGRVLYYNFDTQTERVIKEVCEECVRGLWLALDSTTYVAIGDLKCLVLVRPGSSDMNLQLIHHERVHSITNCPYTQVLMFEDNVCIAVLEPQSEFASLAAPAYSCSLFVTNLNSQSTKMFSSGKFSMESVLLDFDGAKLLWVEWVDVGLRSLHVFFFAMNENRTLLSGLKNTFGEITFGKLLNDRILLVLNGQRFVLLDINSDSQVELFQTGDEVVAMTAFVQNVPQRSSLQTSQLRGSEVQPDSMLGLEEESKARAQNYKLICVAVCQNGAVQVFEHSKQVEEIQFCELLELTARYQRAQYFSMGYPYIVAAYGPRIALSTDLGVLILRSRYLESVSI